MNDIQFTEKEISEEKLGIKSHAVIFITSLIMIPITIITQCWFTLVETVKIPNSVVNAVTFHEKMKTIIRRKNRANIFVQM